MTTVPVKFDLKPLCQWDEMTVKSDLHLPTAPLSDWKQTGLIVNGWYGNLKPIRRNFTHSPVGNLPIRTASARRTRTSWIAYNPENHLYCQTMRQLCNTLHMGVIAVQLSRKLHWDNQTLIEDETASSCEPPGRLYRFLNKRIPRAEDWAIGYTDASVIEQIVQLTGCQTDILEPAPQQTKSILDNHFTTETPPPPS